MPIGSIGLKNNMDCCKPKASKAQSFGKKEHDGEHKNHKAAYIAGSVGLVAALAVAAYIFRGKIAELPIFKKTMEMGEDILKKTKDFSKDAIDKTKKFSEDALGKVKKTTENVIDATKEFGEKAINKAKEVKDNVVDVTQEFAQKVKVKAEDAADKGKKVFKRTRSKVFDMPVLKPTFSAEETALLTRFKKTGANQQGVFDTLKKYGMKETEEKYIKETLTLLKEKFAKTHGSTKTVSLRTIINEALKKGNPQDMIDELMTNSKNMRQLWKL